MVPHNRHAAVFERYLYDPYGRRMVLDGDWSGDSDNTSDVGFVHGHQGLRYDATVGLYDSRLRPYDPELGRFVSQDPLGYIDGPNRYQGYGSSPGNYVDPMGLSYSDPIGGVAPAGGVMTTTTLLPNMVGVHARDRGLREFLRAATPGTHSLCLDTPRLRPATTSTTG